MGISPSKEDYLKAIYQLNGAHENVSNKDLAAELSVSAASVTEMNNRLVKEELIAHIPYKGVQLTESGLRTANQLVRKHRIWEVFLYEKLGFKWDEVHAEADRLEHASSDALIERLSEFLGHPQYDPHGGLIPNADGTLDEAEAPLFSLADIEIGAHFLVKEVQDDEDLLNYLFDKGISLNHSYQLLSKDSYDSTITIRDLVSLQELTVSGKAISSIQVVKLGVDE